ncbi:hypothetical protein BDF22DRAFT_739662 [Syncephalis plumigaleata]|nr:hypothetical protein BDF22DRAFT_739662 [Syncephalis plumigaleata]
MPHFNPFTPCANTIRRMNQIFRKDAASHLRSTSGASATSAYSTASSATPPSTPTTPSYQSHPFYFASNGSCAPSPATYCRSPSSSTTTTASSSASASPLPLPPASPVSLVASPFFSDPSTMDARSPYRRRSRPQMLAATSVAVGAPTPIATSSLAYPVNKRNSVSSNHSYNSYQSLSYPGLEDEIQEPASERLRRRFVRMARKMKRKMSAASRIGRKLRRNGSSKEESAAEPDTTLPQSPVSASCTAGASSEQHITLFSSTRRPTSAPAAVEDPWMDLEWQF